ncbi:hypothetical protein CEXT_364651 [Caerostris extrusa]|uniref:Uncharacterized protein n=1 Tax=Caerostris extrusa TaxID=172846 RepID=A0AAV4VEA5_CAEEX|nr:hypothetical protein CEXT_364651 [Caerostris extrusa]
MLAMDNLAPQKKRSAARGPPHHQWITCPLTCPINLLIGDAGPRSDRSVSLRSDFQMYKSKQMTGRPSAQSHNEGPSGPALRLFFKRALLFLFLFSSFCPFNTFAPRGPGRDSPKRICPRVRYH